MGEDIDLYSPQLPADPSGWSVDDHIAALREVDRASVWAKVRITGLLAARHGDGTLQRAAEQVGIALSTLKSWRSVDRAFPVQEFGRPNFSVAVAEAFMGLDDREALVSREEPWTQREARELAASRRKPRAARKAGRPSSADGRPASAGQGRSGADGAGESSGEPRDEQPAGGTAAAAPLDDESAQEPPGGQEAAARPSEPAGPGNPAAEIPVVPGDSPGGGQEDEAAQDTQEPGLAELKAENAELHEKLEAVRAVAAELAACISAAGGGWRECAVCKEPWGLPVRIVPREGGKDGEGYACTACLPELRVQRPKYQFAFRMPPTARAGEPDGKLLARVSALEEERNALEAELGRLRVADTGEAP